MCRPRLGRRRSRCDGKLRLPRDIPTAVPSLRCWACACIFLPPKGFCVARGAGCACASFCPRRGLGWIIDGSWGKSFRLRAVVRTPSKTTLRRLYRVSRKGSYSTWMRDFRLNCTRSCEPLFVWTMVPVITSSRASILAFWRLHCCWTLYIVRYRFYLYVFLRSPNGS